MTARRDLRRQRDVCHRPWPPAADRLSGLTKVSGFCAEGARLVRQVEERSGWINQDSAANAGAVLAAADIAQAMRRVQSLIEARHDGMGNGVAFSPVIRPALEKHTWWPLMAWVGQTRGAVSKIGDAFAVPSFLRIVDGGPGALHPRAP
jgi:hypothetical protein